MAFDWGDFCAQGFCPIGKFVEAIVYCDRQEWKARGFNKNVPLVKIDDMATKQSIMEELELTLLLRRYLTLCHTDNLPQGGKELSRALDDALDDLEVFFEAFEAYIQKYKEESFPILPKERVYIEWLEIRGRGPKAFGPVNIPQKYSIKELINAVFLFHSKGGITAPQSLREYMRQLMLAQGLVPQPQSQAVVPSVSAEAQLPPPRLTTPQDDVDQDDAPINSKRKISYLKLVYGLLKANGLPTELNLLAKKDTSAGDIKRELERWGVSLDADTIRDILGELEEKRNKIISG